MSRADNISDDEKLRRLGIDPSEVRHSNDGNLRVIEMGGNAALLITAAPNERTKLSEAQARRTSASKIIGQSIAQLKRDIDDIQCAGQKWSALEAWAKASSNWRRALTAIVDMGSAFLLDGQRVTRDDFFRHTVQEPYDAMLADLKRLAPKVQEQKILVATREWIRKIRIQDGVDRKRQVDTVLTDQAARSLAMRS